MKLLVFGSLNIDHTYHLPHQLREGETLPCLSYTKQGGGKGFNQAIALARAGQSVSFAGAIGEEGRFLKETLEAQGVDTHALRTLAVSNGHAIIMLNEKGGNAIVYFGGANQALPESYVEEVLAEYGAGDYVLLQNEINCSEQILRKAAERGMRVILNPSPISSVLATWPLEAVDWLILNEIEGEDLTGFREPEAILDALITRRRIPHVVLTLGERGAMVADSTARLVQPAMPTEAVDTTAAGDTFTGYFFAALLGGKTPAEALRIAATAAAIAVSRPGAADSVPWAKEVEEELHRL